MTIKKEKKRQGKVQGGRNANLSILERSNKTIEIIFKDTCMLNESYKTKNIHLKIMVKTLKCCSKSLKVMWHVFLRSLGDMLNFNFTLIKCIVKDEPETS